VTKEAAEAHKRDLIEAAGRLFRERGLDGVGVAEISRAAGLTHGAIYSGFASKSELAVAALQAGRDASRRRAAKMVGAAPDVKAILAQYISKRQRDNRTECCPLVASASEAARQDANYRRSFEDLFLELAATVQAAMERQGRPEARRRALAVTAGMVGAVAMARALHGRVSDELLSAARTSLAELAED
jgi:TetR/AcrR family transcriptional repressor of nem operon